MHNMNMHGDGMPYEPYSNDIARRLSGANSSEDVISSLRAMNLGDEWWMYSFKVTPCCKTFSHKWTLCPCAHAGETARRRDPRLHPYRAVLCPLAKMKKTCPMGDNCMWSHNVFEHWLHPSRYKTRLCSFGRGCNRPICFFAHSSDELRTAAHVDDGGDLDEREYLMHLMASQKPGMVPQQQQRGGGGGHMQQAMRPDMRRDMRPDMRMNLNNQHLSNQHSVDMANLNSLVMMNSLPQMQRQASLNTHMPSAQDMRDSMQLSQQQGQKQQGSHKQQEQQQSANLDAQSLLLGLQESLANFTMSSDGGWSSIPGGGQGRISDPGSSHQPHVNPMRHLNRISDSGQTLPLGLGHSNKATLVNLESLLNSALANAITQPASAQPPAQPAPRSSASQLMQQQQTLQTASSTDSQSCPLPSVPPPPTSPPRSSGGPGPDPSGSCSSSCADSSVQELIAQLQQQGIVTSKEQLVASLTQLLAQLLATN